MALNITVVPGRSGCRHEADARPQEKFPRMNRFQDHPHARAWMDDPKLNFEIRTSLRWKYCSK
jgi:hypothetical protein